MICVPRPFCEGMCAKLASFSCHRRLQLPSLCLPLKSRAFHPKAAEVFFSSPDETSSSAPLSQPFPREKQKRHFQLPRKSWLSQGSPLCKRLFNFGKGETDYFTGFILKLKQALSKRQEDVPQARKGRQVL